MKINAMGIEPNECTGKYDDPVDPIRVQICERFIRRICVKRGSFNPKSFSYHMKHVVEDVAGVYISNGDFIQAAVNLGYEVKPDGHNAIFKMGFAI
jgi:hypothetical protein